jgi:hypothetical protein
MCPGETNQRFLQDFVGIFSAAQPDDKVMMHPIGAGIVKLGEGLAVALRQSVRQVVHFVSALPPKKTRDGRGFIDRARTGDYLA